MNVLGVDTSSSSSGHTLVIDGELHSWGVWKPTPTEQKVKGVTRIWSYYQWLNTYIGMRKHLIDMVVVEELAVARGAKTARILGNFETVALIVPRKHGLPVVRVKAGVARNLVLGMNPNSSKEDVLVEVRKQYPQIKWPPKNQGGEDVADAFVAALAGPLAMS